MRKSVGGWMGGRGRVVRRVQCKSIFFLEYSWQMFRISQTSSTTVPSASPVEGSRRSGVIRLQNALKNASVVAGGGVSRTGVSLLGMPVYVRGKH